MITDAPRRLKPLEVQTYATHECCLRHRVAFVDFILLGKQVLTLCPYLQLRTNTITECHVEQRSVFLLCISRS